MFSHLKMKMAFFLIVSLLLSTASCTNKATTEITDTGHVNGEKIIFYSGRDGNTEIYSMNPDGSNPLNLTNDPHSDTCPAVYPNGDQIAFLSDRDGINALYTMKLDGSGLKKILSDDVPLGQPAWSSDGEKIAFIKDMGDRTEIWIVNSNGTNPIRITDNEYRDERPVFSPDFKKILFMSNRESAYRIYSMDIDGANVSKIETPSNASSSHLVFPVWSPDGTKIAYSENNPQNRKAKIMVLALADGKLSELTEQDGRNENPCFSPDGSKIVFQSERDGNFEIYCMNLDGLNPVRLTNSSGWDGWAVWASPQTSN